MFWGLNDSFSPLAGGYVYAVNNLLGIAQAAFVSAGVELPHQLAGREGLQIRIEGHVRALHDDSEAFGRGFVQRVLEGLAGVSQPTFAVAEAAFLGDAKAIISLAGGLGAGLAAVLQVVRIVGVPVELAHGLHGAAMRAALRFWLDGFHS